MNFKDIFFVLICNLVRATTTPVADNKVWREFLVGNLWSLRETGFFILWGASSVGLCLTGIYCLVRHFICESRSPVFNVCFCLYAGMSSKMASTPSSSSSAASGSPHLCLRWNNYQSNLTSVFDQLLQNETFVDVTLAADGHAIKAHRMVLSACSPYFQHLFFDNPCQHPIVILKDTRWPELKAIVEYMYRGEISVAQEELTSLLRVAETLKIRGLSELNSDRHTHATAADDRSDSSPLMPTIHPSVIGSASSSRRLIESPTWPPHQVQQAWPHVVEEETATTPTPSPSPAPASRSSGIKRRRISGSESPAGAVAASSPAAASTPGMHHQHHEEASLDHHDGPLSLVGGQPPPPPPHSPVASSASSLAPQALTQAPPPPSSLHQQHPLVHSDDLDIKPGIAELIREEERVS